MSDTPRTDANVEKVYYGAQVAKYVRADFCRQLERELAEHKRMLGDALDAIKRWQER